MFILTGCSDNITEGITPNTFEGGDGVIRFEASTPQDWEEVKGGGGSDAATRGCVTTNEDEPVKISGSKQELYLEPSMVYGINDGNDRTHPLTRSSSIVTQASDLTSFGVLAYQHATGASATTPNFFYKQEFVKGSSTWTSTANYYWPASDKKLDFYAYYPYNNSAIVVSANTATGNPKITYTVPANASQQVDLMGGKVTNAQKTSSTYTQPLTMTHALCAVTFSIGENLDNGTITSIVLKNVYGKGVYTIGATGTTTAWPTASLANATSSFTADNIGFSTKGKTNTAVTTMANGKAFMMIPQTTPSNATAEIHFTDASGAAMTFSAAIGGHSWPQGATVDYKITTTKGTETGSNWSYVFTVSNPTISYEGGTATYTVTSYRKNSKTGQEVAVPWTCTGLSNPYGATTTSAIVSSYQKSGNGGAKGDKATVTVTGTTKTNPKTVTASDITKLLKDSPAKGASTSTATYYDLSLANIQGVATSRNTANCYVVSAPGYYKIPLVYGNAILKGATNSKAYTGTPNKDYKDKAITSPYIKSSGTPTSAIICWQDANNLVQNVSVDMSYQNTGKDKNGKTVDTEKIGYLKFYVSPSTIQQGNAVIAVRDASGTIMWSWHIWVTFAEYFLRTVAITNFNNVAYDFMPVNLGWCSNGGTSSTYPKRSVTMSFKQSVSGKTATATMEEQQADVVFTTGPQGNNPYYQYGRKDPMLPGLFNYNDNTFTDKPQYGSRKFEVKKVGKVSYGTGIQNPNVFYWVAKDNWCNTEYNSLWCVNNIYEKEVDINIVKTIYDPNPVGFKMPTSTVYFGFTSTGSNETDMSKLRKEGDFNHGWYLYVNNSKTSTVFFAATGFRAVWQENSDFGVIVQMGDAGYYGTALRGVGNATGVTWSSLYFRTDQEFSLLYS